MKGKHRQAAQRRRSQAEHDELTALAAELLAEDTRARAAESRLPEVQQAQRLREAARRSRDDAAADEATRLARVLDELAEAVEAEEALADDIVRAWDGVKATLASFFGGGVEAWEGLLGALNGADVRGVLETGVVNNGQLGLRGVHAIQRARGLRHRAGETAPNVGGQLAGEAHAFLRPSADAALKAAGPAEQARLIARARRIAASPPTVDDPDVAYAWSCCSGLVPTWDDVLAPFGCVYPDEADDWAAAAPATDPQADRLAAATEQSAEHLLEDGRWANPLQPPSKFARPSDAAVLRWWYRQQAMATAVMVREFSASEAEPDEVERQASMLEGYAAMLDQASLYWLPQGQGASYLSSQPLSDEDRNDLRLPFGHTLVVPAEPIVCPPLSLPDDEPPSDDLLAQAASIAHAVGVVATRPATRPLGASVRGVLNVGEAVRLRGALVEGVLLEADRSGRRTERVLWCLAVPTGDGTAVFGRVVVAGWASRTNWGDILDQLAAVAAWGDWAEVAVADDAGTGPNVAGPDRQRRRRPVPPGWLQVLDVARTERPSGRSEPTGRKMPPHTRRGHWRRQHSGPGGVVVRRVRIAPTVVNASRGPLAPRV